MQKRVLNKQEKFGVKILWRYTDMAIFVLRCFILTHPVFFHLQHHLLTVLVNVSSLHGTIYYLIMCYILRPRHRNSDFGKDQSLNPKLHYFD